MLLFAENHAIFCLNLMSLKYVQERIINIFEPVYLETVDTDTRTCTLVLMFIMNVLKHEDLNPEHYPGQKLNTIPEKNMHMNFSGSLINFTLYVASEDLLGA